MSATTSYPARSRATVLVVLGMHRSGTSALMGAYHKLGMRLGDRLLPERDDNRTGFWENQAVVAFNQSLNAALNRTWHEIVPMPEGWWKGPAFRAKLAELVTLLETEIGDAGVWGMKDPRTCRTLPLWQKAFKKAALEPVYCLTLRHPTEVADSLAKRDGFGQAKSRLLWLDHVLAADWHTRKGTRLWIHYPDLLEDPRKVIESISASLGLPWSRLTPEQADELTAFVKPSLRNHKAVTESAPASPLAELCIDLYERLRSAPESKETRQAMAKARREWHASAGLFSSWVMDQNKAFAAVQDEILAARNSHMARDEMDFSRDELIARQRQEIQQLQTELATSQDQQAVLAASLEARIHEIAMARKHIDDLGAQIQFAKSVHDDQFEQIQAARYGHEQKDLQLDQARHNIAILQSQIETAARVHEEKERQIASARDNMAVLEHQVTTAREIIAQKDRELDVAREGSASLQSQIQQARDIQDSLARDIEAAKATIEAQVGELTQARRKAEEVRLEIDQARQTIESLCLDIEVAREGHHAKDHQIAEARTLLDALLADLATAKEGHDIKDRQLDQARENIAALQSQIEIARQLHESKDEQLEYAKRQVGQRQAELAKKTRQLDEITRRIEMRAEVSAKASAEREPEPLDASEALARAQATIARQAEEIEIARQVHDQKISEIEYAREIHDEMANRLEQARANIATLAEQIEQARQSHRARDQIEAELRRQLYELRHPQPKHHAGDPTLRPQTES